MANISTTTTPAPDTQVELESRKRLSPADWDALSNDIMIGCQTALGARSTLDQNLVEWNEAYEQLAPVKNYPWENSANIYVPLISTQLDSLVAYISGQVLVQRLILISGLTAQAQGQAALVERYYNAELKRQRGDSTWFEQLYQWLHLSARDGLGYIEALWKYKNTKIKAVDKQPRMIDGEEGQPPTQAIDDVGMPIYDNNPIELEDIYNDVEWKAVELRNVFTIPAAATSVESAMAVVKVEYLYEDQLMELVRDGILDAAEVDRALSFVPTGATELASSQQPTEQYTAGLQLNLGNGQGSQTSAFFRNRGPIEVYRVHSRQYDLDKDGTCEENVFWVHRNSWRMLGWMRYEYLNGLRPFFPFAPFPRPGTLLGYSLVERLMGLQNEENALRNQRLDEGSIRLSPPFVIQRGTFLDKDDFAFGPTETIEVDAPNGDVSKVIQRLDLGEMPQYAFLEERGIKSDAQEFTGLSNASVGQQSGARRSAQEAKMMQAAAMTRTGLLAIRFRMAIRPLLNFTHALKKQYLTTDQNFSINGDQLTVPLQVLQQDFQIDISGASDPIDSATRRSETLAAVQMFMSFPLIQMNPMHQYALLRKAGEAMDWTDIDKIIGTEQEMQQMIQAQQQQAAAQAGQPGAPGGAPGGAGGGAPPGGKPDNPFQPGGIDGMLPNVARNGPTV